MEKFIFGVFEDGRIVYAIGGVFNATAEQAEAIALMLEPSFKDRLPNGWYLAYDHAANHHMG